MTLVTGASLGMNIYCAANPKACFGSCPTFCSKNGDTWRLEAEGFSSSAPDISVRKKRTGQDTANADESGHGFDRISPCSK